MESLFLKILNMSLTGAMVILAVLLARLLLRRAPKAFSYALWAVVLFRLLCPVRIYSGLSWLPAVQTTPAGNGQTAVIVHVQQPALSAPAGAVNDYLAEHPIPVRYTSPEGVYVPEMGAFPLSDTVPDWALAASAVWLAGAALLLAYSALTLLRLRRKLAASIPLEGEKNVRLADRIPSPFVLGLLRPTVYLPSGLPVEERDYVLLHERTHIRRLDHVTRALAWLALSLHWFNPLAWLAFHLAGKDMEMSCDEAVLRKMGRDVRADYSSSLLRLSAGKRLPVGPLAFGDGDPKARIKNVLSWKKPALWVILLALAGVVGIAAALGTDPGSFLGPGKPQLTFTLSESRKSVLIGSDRADYMEWYIPDRASSDLFEEALAFSGVTLRNGWRAGGGARWTSGDHNAVRMDLISTTEGTVTMGYTVALDSGAVIERQAPQDSDPSLSDEEAAELAQYFAACLRAVEEWYERERDALPLPELEAGLTLTPYQDTIRLRGSVGDFSLGWGTTWNPPSWEHPWGDLAMPYPPFDSWIVGGVRVWWTDAGRTAVEVMTRPMAHVSSYMPCGYWSFTVELRDGGGTVSGMTPHILGEGSQGPVRMLPESISNEEAVQAARVAAKLLTAAEDYYYGRSVSSSPGPAPKGLWMEVVPGTVTPAGVAYELHNETESDWMYGRVYSLQVEEGGVWRDVEAQNEMFFTLEGILLGSGQSVSETIDWSRGYGELPPGHYRVTKELSLFWEAEKKEDVLVSAEFRILE